MSDEQREEMMRKQREYQRQTNINTANQKHASTNHSEMDQSSPIILDKENIQPNAHGNHIHVGIGTATTTGSALSMASGKYHIRNFMFI
jgi:hypothetical protein